MHTESSHSHPVVMVFISILQAARLQKIEKDKKRGLSEVTTTKGMLRYISTAKCLNPHNNFKNNCLLLEFWF